MKFGYKVGLLEQFGTLIDGTHIGKLTGYDNLWEIRIKEGAILHRFFFGLGADGLIGVACVVPKTSPRLGAGVLRTAESKVAAYLVLLERPGR